MRIIVMSDSHGNTAVMPKIARIRADADVFLFLGDGCEEFIRLKEYLPEKQFVSVRGNCDWHSGYPVVAFMEAGDVKIMLTHGHTYNVKTDTSRLIDKARENKANILLFGHTHIAEKAYTEGLYVMNPGSVALPRFSRASYGVIDIDGKSIFTGITEI